MILLVLSVGWCAAVALLLVRAIVQYSHYEVIGPVDPDEQLAAPMLTVIIPARNEEASIARCVQSVLSQSYSPDSLNVVVVDDDSHDRTVEIVQQIGAQDPRVTLLRAPPLPPGWLGKPHACAQAARQASGEFLCFLDADTIAQTSSIATAIHTLQARSIDLLSLQPFQELVSFAERLILPAGFFLLAFTQDLRLTNDPASPSAAVNGQFLLVRRSSYESVGGHAGVRDRVAEDSALAANLKSAGFRVMVLGTRDLLHTRMYGDFRSLWEGTARQAGTLLGNNVAMMVAAMAAVLLAAIALLLPLFCALNTLHAQSAVSISAVCLSLLGSLALFGTHMGAARYFRIPLLYGLLFPLGYLLGAGVLLYAIWQRAQRQVRWKGRTYGDQAGDANQPTQAGAA